jgi:hypothetical protein
MIVDIFPAHVVTEKGLLPDRDQLGSSALIRTIL